MKNANSLLLASLVGLPLVGLSVVQAQAAELPSFAATDFKYMGIKALRESAPPQAPAVKAEPQDRITKGHLLVQCGNDKLLGFADTEEQYKETVSFWGAILGAAGIEMGQPSFKDKTIYIPYKTKDGSVIRDFLADPKQFKPKDEADLRANKDVIEGQLGKAGYKIIASHVLDLEYLLPTYKTYYLTKPNEAREHEAQVRILNRGEDIDFDVFEKEGTNILQKPNTWMMVYLGPELGFVTRIGKDRADIEKKIKDRVDYLVGVGKKMIDTRIHELKPEDQWEDYKFLGNIYFYQ
ncbi:MAG: hypothetical protein WC728_13420 [Elusimicrobiota bacterium]